MNAPASPPGWWYEPPFQGRHNLWRLDGMVLATASGMGEVHDPQTGVAFVVSFAARAPRYLRNPTVAMVSGESPEEVCARADAAWAARSEAPTPVSGMVVWHDRTLWTIAASGRSLLASTPPFHRDVWRMVLVPMPNQQRAITTIVKEVPVNFWPRGFLIHDPLDG